MLSYNRVNREGGEDMPRLTYVVERSALHYTCVELSPKELRRMVEKILAEVSKSKDKRDSRKVSYILQLAKECERDSTQPLKRAQVVNCINEFSCRADLLKNQNIMIDHHKGISRIGKVLQIYKVPKDPASYYSSSINTID